MTSELIRLNLDNIGWMGDCLAEHEGERVFVFGGIPGEEVMARVTSRRRKRLTARVVEVLSPSENRVDPVCPYYGDCTGCQWQHIGYEYQLHLKHALIQDALAMDQGLTNVTVRDVIPSISTFGYRNHARFTVGPDGNLGFVNRDTRRFIRIDECLLMHPWINRTLAMIQGLCGETTQLSIRYGVNTGEYSIQPAMKSADIPVPTGQKHYEEQLKGMRFRVASSSFFQVNTPQAERMIELVRQFLSLEGNDLVVDAYAGVATFAALLAGSAGKVIAIEDSASAVEDARVNTSNLPNVELLQARTETALAALEDPPDVLILDPPRAGCLPEALESVKGNPPRLIVYVSCDPRALARDLAKLSNSFDIEELQPLDLFPQTRHIECVARLSRR
ncbi:MAG: class I SAM-dependent RNA methyltransferase [Dehalococcoidia bacterium]